jgi:predicted RNase H-like HicB family nuclease
VAPRFHVFDVHGDIELGDDLCSKVVLSESSKYGFNPLKINPDPHSGGVRKAIRNLIETIKLSPDHGRNLGPKQQDILRNLANDVYANAGIDADIPSSWVIQPEDDPVDLIADRIYVDIPFHEKDLAKNAAQADVISLLFHRELRCWHVDEYRDGITRWPRKRWGARNPTLNDLCVYAARRREMSYTGLGLKEAECLDAVHSRAKALQRALQRAKKASNNNGSDSDEADEQRDSLQKAKDNAMEALEKYLSTVETGRALDDLLKYDSYDSLSTVKQILDTLNSSGVFRDEQPNFDWDKPIWRYHIKNLSDDEKKFLVNLRLREIFNFCVREGESNGVLRDVIIIDEGAKFVKDEPDHIINVIALEARKFGLAIWFASQSPTHYPEALMSSMGTKVILGLDSTFWAKAQSQLRIDPEVMRWIRPRHGLLLNRKIQGQPTQGWEKLISYGSIHKD